MRSSKKSPSGYSIATAKAGDVNFMVSAIVSFVLGVFSSILAVVLGSLFNRSRKSLDERSLRTSVGFYGEKSAVIAPSFMVTVKGTEPEEFETPDSIRVVRDKDVYAVARAVEVCRRLKSDPQLVSAKTKNLDLPNNLVCVGSWSGNDFTDSFQNTYCPGFQIVNRESEDTDFDSIYYQCGGQDFRDTAEIAHAFMVHLSPQLTGMNGHIVMLWGHHGFGNRAAVQYLSESHKKLSALGKSSYFCVVKVGRREGYKQTVGPLIDISEAAFTPR